MTTDAYYGTVRQQVIELCPDNIDRAFEVGCGYGSTLDWLKTHKNYNWVGGAEISPVAAMQARGRLDFVFEGDVEHNKLPLEKESLDLLLCLDVLEHLRDPWEFLAKASMFLKEGGTFVASLPNLRHHTVILPLLLRGDFTYQEAGLLDQTHLRFFTRSGAISLVESAGIHVELVAPTGMKKGSKANFLNKLTFGLLEGIFAYQYIIRGIKVGGTRE